ncbi:MAG: hypothetical protein M1358_06965, partial [Chloroflexi bacterium]|nr:hypothetical protein [Chloroflexota bacterium]
MKRVCIDVGGTFTDCLVLDETGVLRQFKSPTTPNDPANGLLNALEKAARFFAQPLNGFLGDVDLLIHGTTPPPDTMAKSRTSKPRLVKTAAVWLAITWLIVVNIDCAASST